MKHISESIIGRKGLENLYIVWPYWNTGIVYLRKNAKFEELETQTHSIIFIISESDLINNKSLFDIMHALFYRLEKPDTISNIRKKLKKFIETGNEEDIIDIGFKRYEIHRIWKKLNILQESIIGRKSSKTGEIIYIFWPKWMDSVDRLRKAGFVELESEKYGFIFLITKSDLKNNEELLNKTKAEIYRSKKTDTIPNVIRKLKDFIDSNMDPRSVFADAGFEFLHN